MFDTIEKNTITVSVRNVKCDNCKVKIMESLTADGNARHFYSLKWVVSSEEAEQLINQGWQFIGTLPSGKVVINEIIKFIKMYLRSQSRRWFP